MTRRKKMDIVVVTCYGESESMDRQDAINFYFERMSCSDGSERERYATIVAQLLNGATEAIDTPL